MLGIRNHYQTEGEVATIPDESAVSSMSDLSTATGNKRIRKRTVITAVPLEQIIGIDATDASAMIRSTASSNIGQVSKHNRNECFYCCRNKVIGKLIDTSLNIQEPKENLTSMNGKIGDSEISFYSPESIVSDDSANTNMPDRISNVILRNCQKLANPILFKPCRKILMELKQKYPQSFQDLCLYSEVCKSLGSCTYRMSIRRFIQEIFLDISFDQMINNNDNDLVINVARQRLADLKLLDSSKNFPSSPPLPPTTTTYITSTTSSSISSSSNTNTVQFAQQHKIHSLKSPLLASVYETSVENLIDSQPIKVEEEKEDKEELKIDEVDSVVQIVQIRNISSPSKGSQQVKAEVHSYRHSSVDPTTKIATESALTKLSSENLLPVRRRRFNTLELDLSCTKNKFPIKHRSHDSSSSSELFDGPLATSTLQRQKSNISTSANTPYQQQQQQSQQSLEMYKKFIASSSSLQKLTSPLSPPSLGTLYCEQRLLQTARSEATLSNKKNADSNINVENNNRIIMTDRKKENEEFG